MHVFSAGTRATTALLLCRDRLTPAPVEALGGKVVTVVAGGWRHTAAADSDGVLYTWGWNKVRIHQWGAHYQWA